MAEFTWQLPVLSFPTPPTTTSTSTLAIDHAEAAIKRLPQQFRTKPKIIAIMRVLCAPMAALEQAYIDLLTKRSLDNAEGEQLNILGRIVGQDITVSVTATTLRSLIRARIRANRSQGLGNQILLVARLVLTDYASQADVIAAGGALKLRADNHGRGGFSIVVVQPDIPWDLAAVLQETFIRLIAGTGIRGITEFTPQVATTYDQNTRAFTFSDKGGGTTGGLGWGSKADGTAGGTITAAIE